MSNKNYKVLCGDDCLHDGMSKEQILAAIEQIISTGEIQDIDTGFITKIKELNTSAALRFWVGTNAQYNALPEKVENCFYIMTDDTRDEDLEKTVAENSETIKNLENGFAELPRHRMLFTSTGQAESATNFGIGGISKYHLLAVTLKMNVLNSDYKTYTEIEYTALIHRMPNTTVFAADVLFIADADVLMNVYFKLILVLNSTTSDVVSYWSADPCGALFGTKYHEVIDFKITKICGIC